MTTEFVMDASAILALIYGESGHDRVAAALPDSRICAVNLAEIVSSMIDEEIPLYDIERRMGRLLSKVVDLDRDLAMKAGLLREATRHKGLSLGDRACLALAMRERLPVMTADRAWRDLDLPVEVVLIREP
jgi:PIN domain nuclease of toxin-antitoxin system